MAQYKSNQVREAIFWTLGAEGERAREITLLLRRLYAADRGLGRRPRSHDQAEHHYAFFSDAPPGTGADILFTDYEAFASLAALMLLEHGLPQETVIRLLRRLRPQLESIHKENLTKDPRQLFDEKALLEQAKPGMIAFQSTEPVILAFARLTGSSVDEDDHGPSVCVDPNELVHFMKTHSPGTGISVFDFSRLVHELANNLLRANAIKRGRRASLP
jgi:hypothetical protein